MLCRACQKFNMKARNGSGVWSAIPCVAIRKDSVQRHSETEAHQQALGLERDGKENTPVNEVFQVQVNMQRLALEGAMKCLYWLGKNEISHTTKFTSLMDFVKGMGCTYLEHLDQGANAHYTSERAIQEMLMSIATVISDDIYKSIRSSPTFSLLMDETTDVAILKQLITYIKYIKTTDNKCEVKTAFVHIDDLADGKACSIVKSTQDMFAQLDLSFTDCTALGSDGAAVMVGRRTGVATQLRELNSSMINIHCVAHRLALAAGQAMAGIPYLKRLSSTLQQLFYFYQNSAVRMAGLQEIQKILGSSEVRLKEAKHVRWLSHQRAVDAVRRSLSSIIVSLERESEERHDATATGLAMFLKQFNFVASILMLSDVLPHLTRLSLMFQKKDVDVTILDTIISSTITAIRTLKTQPGTHTMNVESYLNEDLAEHSVTSTDAVKQRFKDQVYDKYIDAVCDNLEQRFPDVQLIGAFSIFDPSLVEDDASPGNVDTLISHYSMDEAAVTSEFNFLKSSMETTYKGLSYREMLETVITKFADITPSLHRLASIALTLPLSTADCERGFSAIGRIKTKLRNRLSEKILQCLTFISVEGPDLNHFDFSAAADIWASKKTRRINLD